MGLAAVPSSGLDDAAAADAELTAPCTGVVPWGQAAFLIHSDFDARVAPWSETLVWAAVAATGVVEGPGENFATSVWPQAVPQR